MGWETGGGRGETGSEMSHLVELSLPDILLLLPAYVVRQDGNVFTEVCLSVHSSRGTPDLCSQVLSAGEMGTPLPARTGVLRPLCTYP